MNDKISLKAKAGFVLVIMALALTAVSCNTYRKINYLQDIVPDKAERIAINKGILIQPKDMISIVVSSRNPELALIFNLPVISYQAGSEVVSDRFAELVLQLRRKYDYVFLDCPPVDIVADTQIIEKLADRTVFIVRAGLLERDMLPELQRNYDEKRFKNMALVLNGTESSGSRYNYRYGYKYGYKYGYGYGYGSKSYYGGN